ncbi:MAG: LysR family transcriptional regulator [Burkholderiaceae bacterium]
MPKRLDLNLLQALEALLAERNVTRAAVRLNTTQPALSAQLARLRRMFDDPLFIPSSRGMTPTPRALEIEERLSDLMNGLRGVVSPLRFDPATSSATISLAATDSTQFLLAPMVQLLHALAPNLRVAGRPVQRLTKPEIDKLLATGQLDMVIGTPGLLPDDLRARAVSTEGYHCVMRKDHPFHETEMTIDDFCTFEHIFVSPFGGDFRGDVDVALEATGRSRRVVVSVPSVLVGTRILETSNFVGVFSESLARREAHILRSYPLPVDIGKLQLVLAWHERTHVNPAHQWFRERIVEAMKRVAEGSEPKEFEAAAAPSSSA